MAEQSSRPFYGEYAWAFDLLIDRPVGQECAAIAAWFSERGVLPGAALLDGVLTDRGKLTFTSTTTLDPERRQLLLSETHTLVNDAGEHSSDYRFVMRCWTRTELDSVFERGGFGSVAYFGAYDPAIHAEATDRLIAVAQLSDVPMSRSELGCD